jgi:hypothetical protein
VLDGGAAVGSRECRVSHVPVVGRTERSEFRLVQVVAEVPELAVARSGLRKTHPHDAIHTALADTATTSLNEKDTPVRQTKNITP